MKVAFPVPAAKGGDFFKTPGAHTERFEFS
jgi:hypothetical protein